MKITLIVLFCLLLTHCTSSSSDAPAPAVPVVVPEITAWTAVDAGGVNGLNKDITHAAVFPRLTVVATKLYVTWAENNAGAVAQIRAAVYNGNDAAPAWTLVDGNGANGLNKDTTKSVATPVSTTVNGKLYLSWVETNGGAVTQIRAAVYNGNDSAPAWTFIDGNGANGLNKDTSKTAATPAIYTFNNKLYLTWQETNGAAKTQIRTVVYNGNDSAPAWTFIDGNGADGMNKDVAMNAATSTFGTLGSKLYLTWAERNAGGAFQTRVAVYNGNDSAPAWTFVDGNGANGLNKSSTSQAKIPSLATVSSKLYIIWREVNASAITQMRIAVYNGNDSAPAWTFVDGNGADGLNFDVTRLTGDMSLVSSNSKLYSVWNEQNATAIYQSHIRVYGGNDNSPTWTAVDGGAQNGINKNVANVATNISCAPFTTYIYCAWSEGATGQIMVSVGK